MINIELFFRYLLVFFVAINLTGCSEQSDDRGDKKNDPMYTEIPNEIREEESGIQGEVNESFVKIDAGRLQINTFLILGEDHRNSIIRFAEIAGSEPVSKIQSRIFIDKVKVSTAFVGVGMELAYQPPGHKGEKTNLTLIRNQFSHSGEGFALSGKAIGCKNEDCSLFFESSLTEDGSYPVSRLTLLSH